MIVFSSSYQQIKGNLHDFNGIFNPYFRNLNHSIENIYWLFNQHK